MILSPQKASKKAPSPAPLPTSPNQRRFKSLHHPSPIAMRRRLDRNGAPHAGLGAGFVHYHPGYGISGVRDRPHGMRLLCNRIRSLRCIRVGASSNSSVPWSSKCCVRELMEIIRLSHVDGMNTLSMKYYFSSKCMENRRKRIPTETLAHR